MSIDWSKVVTLEDKFEQARERKYNEIGQAYNAYIKGSFVCSLGFPMQFNESDSLKMEGAIKLLELQNVITGVNNTGYLTDAENITHYGVTVEQMKTIQIEMLMKFAEAHSKKQLLRQQIKDIETKEELELIKW